MGNNMSYNLFLDDLRSTYDAFNMTLRITYISDQWVIVRSYDEFVSYITKNGLPGRISFDHDLGEGKTGHDCAHWLIEYCLDRNLTLPEWRVHSMNPVGKDNIDLLLLSFKKFQDGDSSRE